MPVINVKVQNKIAQAEKNVYIVCGNSDYIINFELGEEWSGHNFKTALFVYNGKLQPVVFEGNSCAVPVLYNTTLVAVGLQSKDKTLITTTPSYIRCEISAEDLGGEIEAPAQDVYDEIIALLNKYIAEGGGSSSGGLTEEQVKQIVSEEIADLQTKTDEGLETQSKKVVGAINELNNKNNSISQDIAVVNAILEQSGIVSKYKATIEDTYSERITADGANVLDGGKAKLEKVVGSTVACKNLVDIEKINASMGDSAVTLEVNFTQNLFVSAGELATVSTSIWRFSCTRKDGTIDYVTDGNLANGGKKVTATADNPIVKIVYRGTNITAGQYSKIMIAYGDTATPYQPYFTGLKSASFGGIESTNTDSTETATLNFPKTETPLGTTIDFENKKIIETYVEYVFKGDETVYSNGAYGSKGYYRYTILNAVDMAKGSAQNGICDRYPTDKSDWNDAISECVRFGQGSSNVIYLILKREATVEEIKVLIKGMTIRYPLATPTEKDFTAQQSARGNEYTAYKGGTEKVLDNDGKEYGAENTLSQNYIIVTEVK